MKKVKTYPQAETAEKQLFDVEVYNGNTLVTVLTVSAASREEASNEAVKNFNVKIKPNYSLSKPTISF